MPKQKIKQIASEMRNAVPESLPEKEKFSALLDDLESGEQSRLKEAFKVIPDFLTRFETEHPQLAESLNEIMVVLSNMGI